MSVHQRSLVDYMKQWADLAKNVVVAPNTSRRSFSSHGFMPGTVSMKTRYNWFMGIDNAAYIECSYKVASLSHQKYRRHAVTIFAKTEDRYTPCIPPDHALYKHMDAWCREAFGRSYRKPGSRWKRGQRADTSFVNDTYFFKNKADAAAFKFHWHQAQLSEDATVLNGMKLEY